MPWVKIHPDMLEHLPMFGIDVIREDGQFCWYHGARGRMYVEKADPRVWVDDDVDALQLGATAILVKATPE
jgi:hypothetical protein